MRDHHLLYLNDMSADLLGDQPSGSSSFRQAGLAPPNQNPNQGKRKRSLPGNPDPEAEVIALSPKSLLATNRFVCEICHKGFQRDQNLQLHRRGHNLPWKLKQRSAETEVRKKVYICPEVTCVHHDPARALGDLTGIKKHFCRKHWEKRWRCERCSKKYAVHSDWKAHVKICGTKEYRCTCGTLFSRRDSFTTHRAFCDALSQENMRSITVAANTPTFHSSAIFPEASAPQDPGFPIQHTPMQTCAYAFPDQHQYYLKREEQQEILGHSWFSSMEIPAASIFSSSPHMSATALLQTAAQMGVSVRSTPAAGSNGYDVGMEGSMDDAFAGMLGLQRQEDSTVRQARRKEEIGDGLTRDFLGLKALYSGDHQIVDMAAGLDPHQGTSSAYDQMQQMGGAWDT